jgi:hypothetical protein
MVLLVFQSFSGVGKERRSVGTESKRSWYGRPRRRNIIWYTVQYLITYVAGVLRGGGGFLRVGRFGFPAEKGRKGERASIGRKLKLIRYILYSYKSCFL